jgi:hypothetical protein
MLHTWTTHSPCVDHPKNILKKIQPVKLLMQFSPDSCYFLVGSDILLHTVLSGNSSPCSFLDVRDQVSHPYETTDRIILYLYILIFTFRDNGREDKVLN